MMEKMGNRFRKAVDAFAGEHDIPIVHFKKGDRHIDVMTPYLEAVFAASRRDFDSGPPSFSFYKADRRVSAYYFYINDADFGHGFIKICSYFPYQGKVWVLWRKIHKMHYAADRVMSRAMSHSPLAAVEDPSEVRIIRARRETREASLSVGIAPVRCRVARFERGRAL